MNLDSGRDAIGSLSKWNQANRLFRVETSLESDTVLLDSFSGTEGLSRPFCFVLSLISEKAGIELKSLIGSPVKVAMKTASGADRYFNGIITQFAHIGSDGGFARYRAELGPWTEYLRHRVSCDVFLQMNVLDIIKKVFQRYGSVAVYEIGAKNDHYQSLPLCIQYRESDLDFVMRLMEEHGLYFYFVFDKKGHILRIEDDSRTAPDLPIEKVVDYSIDQGTQQQDSIDSWQSVRKLISNSYAIKTFDFKKPKSPLKVVAKTTHKLGKLPELEFFDYWGSFGFESSAAGEKAAKLRMEELELRSKYFSGSGNVRHFALGHCFELARHYDIGKDKADRTFFLMSLSHEGKNNLLSETDPTFYRNTFTCIRKTIPFRPPLTTQKPVISGPQTAVVVGPEGEEIHTDAYGRVKIQFHWDREGHFAESSSCWVRVASTWAGGRFGMIALPRIGTEVLVEFLDGNPDRPVITGMLFNETHMPPWGLPEAKTQSGILSRSTKGGGYDNANALRFEDGKGKEEIWLHAEKDHRIEVQNDENHSVGHDRKTEVKNEETLTIGANRTKKVSGDETITITGNRQEQIDGNEESSVKGNHKLSVTRESSTQAQQILLDAGQELTLQAGAAKIILKCDGSITLEGVNFKLDAKASASMTSAAIKLESNGIASLKGSVVKVEAGVGTIQATGPLSLKGMPLKGN